MDWWISFIHSRVELRMLLAATESNRIESNESSNRALLHFLLPRMLACAFRMIALCDVSNKHGANLVLAPDRSSGRFPGAGTTQRK